MHLSLLTVHRPLIVVGKGAAQSYADSIIRHFVDKVQIPVLSTSMGRGVIPDNHPLSVIAARSMALAKADVVLILGARYFKLLLQTLAESQLLAVTGSSSNKQHELQCMQSCGAE